MSVPPQLRVFCRHLLPSALWAVYFLTMVIGPGCAPQDDESMPEFAVNVIVELVVQKAVVDRIELVGSLSANERVEIKSEISGVLREIHFTEGGAVQSGQLLIKLDERKLRARLDEAQANFGLARTNMVRNQSLVQSNTVSEQVYDQSRSEFEAEQAAVELRRRELEETVIYAPFDGKIGIGHQGPHPQTLARVSLDLNGNRYSNCLPWRGD